MTKKERDDGYRVVFSTDKGSLCPDCQRPTGSCDCAERAKRVVVGDGQIRVRRETKGRGGKTVTTVSGLPLNSEQLSQLGKDLKRTCGSGGAVKDGVVEIQGDHCEVVMRELDKRGFKAKRAGG